MRAIAQPLRPVAVHGGTWQDGVVQCDALYSWIAFALPKPVFVHAIRIRCTFEKADGTRAYPYVQWHLRQQEGPPARETGARICIVQEPVERTFFVWVSGTIDAFRIGPGLGRGVLRIAEIALIVPEANQ